MEPNYYEILGVPESATHEEVQEAYRRLAKAYHPDRSGGDTVNRFREVQEAWEVLGSPKERRAYDARRRPARRPHVPRPPSAGRSAPPPRHGTETLPLELRMSPAETFTGGAITLELPAWQPCGRCGGQGRFAGLRCPACRGRGRVLAPERFTLHVPPWLEDGQVVELALDDLPNLLHRRLVILVRVR